MFEKIALTLFIAFLTGWGAASVGRMPKQLDTPYDWTLPMMVLLITLLPALLGYFAGREDGRNDK